MECYWQSTTDRWKLKWPLGVNKSKSSEFGSIKGREGGGGLRLCESQQASGTPDPAVCQRSSQVSSHWASRAPAPPHFLARMKRASSALPLDSHNIFLVVKTKLTLVCCFSVSSSMTPVSIISEEREMFSGHLWVSGGLGWERSA